MLCKLPVIMYNYRLIMCSSNKNYMLTRMMSLFFLLIYTC